MNTVYLRSVNKWRSNFNPLRGLSIQRIASLLEEGERGAYADLQWLYRTIEKRDAVLRAGRRRRSAALACLDWKIKIIDELPAGATEQMAQAQADILQKAYNAIDNIKEAIDFLSLAEFRGFSHLEKHFDAAGNIFHLEPVPQWYWVRDGLNGLWQYNTDAKSGTINGIQILPQNFIIREVDDPINEIAVISFIRRNLSQKDWDGFIETYGIPPLFIKMPPNIPADRQQEFQNMAEAVISDARGSLPNGSDIQTIESGARGNNPFKEHIAYQDQYVVLAITGGKLTMLNDPTGLGSGQSQVHEKTFQELAEAEAKQISELFQRNMDQPLLATAFPETPAALRGLAYFELATIEKDETSQIIDDALKLSQAGYRITASELSEKTGYTLTDAPVNPAPFSPQLPLHNRQAPTQKVPDANSQLITTAIAEAVQARPEWLAPLKPWIQELIQKINDSQLSDSDLLDFIEKATTKLPEFFGNLNQDVLAKILESALGTAVVQGVQDAQKESSS
jgi:phage gp29-like protein